jgi:hypothetical protein
MPEDNEEETKVEPAAPVATIPVGHMQGKKIQELISHGYRVSGGDVYLEKGTQKAKIDRFGKVTWVS